MTPPGSPSRLAQWLAIAVPALLLGGAYVSEYVFGLFPCEMCWWQRYAHIAAIPLALLGFFAPPRALWVALAGVAILASGLIGAYHAGVEYHWWQGATACSGFGTSFEDIMNAQPVRCDEAPWALAGVSLAGFNFLISTGAAIALFALLARRRSHG